MLDEDCHQFFEKSWWELLQIFKKRMRLYAFYFVVQNVLHREDLERLERVPVCQQQCRQRVVGVYTRAQKLGTNVWESFTLITARRFEQGVRHHRIRNSNPVCVQESHFRVAVFRVANSINWSGVAQVSETGPSLWQSENSRKRTYETTFIS